MTNKLADLLPALALEGLLPAVVEVERLLASQVQRGRIRQWAELNEDSLLDHLRGHVDEVAWFGLDARDDGTGKFTAAHATARSLMILACALADAEGGGE